jgi:hypothetical protein
MLFKNRTEKTAEETLEHKVIKRYRWEYRLRSIGIKPFNLKKAARVAPALAIGLSSWVLPIGLAAFGASALVIAGAVIAAKLGAVTYASVVIGKEFREASRQMHAGIEDGSLIARYHRDIGEKVPPLERFLEKTAPEKLIPGNDNKKGLFNFFSRKKTKAQAAPKPAAQQNPPQI